MTTAPGADSAKLPLDGVRIVDLTVVWAGPYATMQLADWGAEIIRVESVHHFASATRGQMPWPPAPVVQASATGGLGWPYDEAGERPWNRTPVFNAHARNKKSVTVDLTRPEGREVLRRLVAISDGLIENNLPPNIEKQGVDWDELSKVNPQLIMVRMPAFGLQGPYRGYRTWGNHMEALVGHTLIRTYPDLSPEYAPTGVPADAAGGVGGAFAFLMGLRQRRRTGQGVLIEAATAENFVSFLGEFVMDYAMNGRTWEQMGNRHWWWAPHNVYPCPGTERWVTIAVRSEDEWRALLDVMRREDLAADPRFADMASRYRHQHALDEIIAAWTRQHDAYWIMYRLQERGVPAGVLMHEGDVLESRQHEARGFFQEIDHAESGRYRHVGRLWQASETPPRPARGAPLLGQDNEYVYRELLGYSAEEYRAFEAQGHIGMDYPRTM